MIRSVSVPLAVSMTIGTSERPPQLAADVPPVSIGEAKVEQHQVWLEALGQLEGLRGGSGDDGLEACSLECLREGLGDRALVLDEQDAAALDFAGHASTVAALRSSPSAGIEILPPLYPAFDWTFPAPSHTGHTISMPPPEEETTT